MGACWRKSGGGTMAMDLIGQYGAEWVRILYSDSVLKIPKKPIAKRSINGSSEI